MILVDSSVWIDYFNGQLNWQTDKLDQMLGRELIITGDIILLEVLQGFNSEKDFRTAKKALEKLPCYTLCDRKLAAEGANHFRSLRVKGITVRKTIDTIIATYCIHYHHTLLHSDRDFKPFEEYLGLNTLQPL